METSITSVPIRQAMARLNQTGDVLGLIEDLNFINHAVLTSSPHDHMDSRITPAVIQRLGALLQLDLPLQDHHNQTALCLAITKLLYNIVDFFPSAVNEVVEYSMEIIMNKLEESTTTCQHFVMMGEYLGIIQILVKTDQSGELCRRLVEQGGIKSVLTPLALLDPKDATKAISIACSLIKRAMVPRETLFRALSVSINMIVDILNRGLEKFQTEGYPNKVSEAINLVVWAILRLSDLEHTDGTEAQVETVLNSLITQSIVRQLVKLHLAGLNNPKLNSDLGGLDLVMIKAFTRLSTYSPLLHKALMKHGIIQMFKYWDKPKMLTDDYSRAISKLGIVLAARSVKKMGPHLIPILLHHCSTQLSGSRASVRTKWTDCLVGLLKVTRKSSSTVLKPFVKKYAHVIRAIIEKGVTAGSSSSTFVPFLNHAIELYYTLSSHTSFKFAEKVQRQGLVGSLEKLIQTLEKERHRSCELMKLVQQSKTLIAILQRTISNCDSYTKLVLLAEQIRELSREKETQLYSREILNHLQALEELANELSKNEGITNFEFKESGILDSLLYYLMREKIVDKDNNDIVKRKRNTGLKGSKEDHISKWSLHTRQTLFAHVFLKLPLPTPDTTPRVPSSRMRSTKGKGVLKNLTAKGLSNEVFLFEPLKPMKKRRIAQLNPVTEQKKKRMRRSNGRPVVMQHRKTFEQFTSRTKKRKTVIKKKPLPAEKPPLIAIHRLIQLLHESLDLDKFPNTEIRYSESLMQEDTNKRQRMVDAMHLITEGNLRVQLEFLSGEVPLIPPHAKIFPLKVHGPGMLKIQNLIEIFLTQNPSLRNVTSRLIKRLVRGSMGQKRKGAVLKPKRNARKRRKTSYGVKWSYHVEDNWTEEELREVKTCREVQNGVHLVCSLDGIDLDPEISVLEALLKVKFPYLLTPREPAPAGCPIKTFQDIFNPKVDYPLIFRFQFKEKSEFRSKSFYTKLERGMSDKDPITKRTVRQFTVASPEPAKYRRRRSIFVDGLKIPTRRKTPLASLLEGELIDDYTDTLDHYSILSPNLLPKLSRHAHRTRYQVKWEIQQRSNLANPGGGKAKVSWKSDPDTQKTLHLLKFLHAFSIHWKLLYRKCEPPKGVETPLLSKEVFENKALVEKFFDQIQDQVVVFTNSIAWWCREFIPEFQFLFPFDMRLLLFRLLGFGHERGIKALEKHLADTARWNPESGNSAVTPLSTEIRMFFATERMKFISVRRDSLLQDSMGHFRYHNRDHTLKVRFQGEDGVGSGPTSEFFTLLGQEMRRRDLGLWMDDQNFKSPEKLPLRRNMCPQKLSHCAITIIRCEKCHLLSFPRCTKHDRLLTLPDAHDSDLSGLFLSGVQCPVKGCSTRSANMTLKCECCSGNQSIDLVNLDRTEIYELQNAYPQSSDFVPLILLVCRTCRAIHFPRQEKRTAKIGGCSTKEYHLMIHTEEKHTNHNSDGITGGLQQGVYRKAYGGFRHISAQCPPKQIFRRRILLPKREVEKLIRLAKTLCPISSKIEQLYHSRRPQNIDSPSLVNSVKLFPRPTCRWRNIFPYNSDCAFFRFLGKLMAQALLERKRIDIPISPVFYEILQEKPVTTSSLLSVLPNKLFANLLMDCAHVCEKRERILLTRSLRSVRNLPPKEFILPNHGCSLADLDLCFQTPEGIPLCYDGDKVAVNLDNLRLYLDGIVKFTLLDGTNAQFDAVRDGFNEICSWRFNKIPLSSEELSSLIQGDSNEEDMDFSPLNLIKNIRVDNRSRKRLNSGGEHALSNLPRTIRMLFEILSTFTKREQRSFIQFVTGSPSLPVGGLAALDPPITFMMNESPTSTVKSSQRGFAVPKLQQRFPGASTCHHILRLPTYYNSDNLRKKLLMAMNNSRFDLS